MGSLFHGQHLRLSYRGEDADPACNSPMSKPVDNLPGFGCEDKSIPWPYPPVLLDGKGNRMPIGGSKENAKSD
jgi:hypothetical protein